MSDSTGEYAYASSIFGLSVGVSTDVVSLVFASAVRCSLFRPRTRALSVPHPKLNPLSPCPIVARLFLVYCLPTYFSACLTPNHASRQRHATRRLSGLSRRRPHPPPDFYSCRPLFIHSGDIANLTISGTSHWLRSFSPISEPWVQSERVSNEKGGPNCRRRAASEEASV